MKKKLFSLLTLALLGMSSAWAEDETIFSADVIATANVAFATGTTEITSSQATITGGKIYAISEQTDSKNLIGKQGSNYMFCMTNNNTYFKVELNKPLEAGDVINAKTYTRTDTGLGLFLSKEATRPGDCSTKLSIATASSAAYEALSSYTVVADDGLEGESTFYIYRETGKSTYFDEFIITRALATDTPVLTATPTAMTFALTPTSQTKSETFQLTGKNLTDGSYNLTIPAVEGLSVTPESFTVADGSVNQTFTVTYASTNDVAEAVANITAIVDELSASVAVTYSSRATMLELATISGAATWDWSKVTANTESERYNSSDKAIKLDENTTPSNTDDVVYENYKDIDYTIASGFDGTTIAFKGQYPIRQNNMCQNGTIHFKTSIPGTITVKFSDTGSSVNASATPRYLIVNGVQTSYWTSRPTSGTTKSNDTKTSGEIYVPAGDVTITGSQAICVYIVTFKPLPASASVAVTDAGYRTFASKYPLDFTGGVSGLKAYKATVAGSAVSFSEVTGKVPAGEGLLLKAAEGSYTIPVASTEPAAIENALVGVTAATEKEAGIYVLMNGAKGLGFYKTTAAFTVGANTAYLPADVAGARTFIGFNDDETTGIESVNIEHSTMNAEHYYDLQGRRVAQPTKGLYILNGKKVFVN